MYDATASKKSPQVINRSPRNLDTSSTLLKSKIRTGKRSAPQKKHRDTTHGANQNLNVNIVNTTTSAT